MSTRPSESVSNKLTTSLDELIKTDRGGRGDRSGGGGVMRSRGRNEHGRDEKPYSRPSRMEVEREVGSGGGNASAVFVGNLAWAVDWRALKAHMCSAGEVVRADVMVGEDGRSRGYGIVEYTSPRGARKAIETLHDSELEGRMVVVREDRGERTERSGGFGERSYGGSRGGGRGGGRMRGESDVDPVYSNSGVTGRNGWVKPELTDFVDDGPPPEPKGSMLR
uniref:RRM domain-containing protein n=1 Tax=Coccolithus braarudii TaxID=221442 RepID=A0A6T7KII8_9EUKA